MILFETGLQRQFGLFVIHDLLGYITRKQHFSFILNSKSWFTFTCRSHVEISGGLSFFERQIGFNTFQKQLKLKVNAELLCAKQRPFLWQLLANSSILTSLSYTGPQEIWSLFLRKLSTRQGINYRQFRDAKQTLLHVFRLERKPKYLEESPEAWKTM